MFKSDLLQKLSAVVLLVGVVVACKSLQSVANPTVLASQDGKFQLTVPAGWSKTTELNDKASIQAANQLKEMYVIVLTEGKEDLASDMTLDKFTEITRKATLSKFTSPEPSLPEAISINGNDARQYELRGTRENSAIDLLITTVKTPAHYHQIWAWTVPSK